jgi:hypothetical protein
MCFYVPVCILHSTVADVVDFILFVSFYTLTLERKAHVWQLSVVLWALWVVGPLSGGPSEWWTLWVWALWVWALWVWALWVVGPLSVGPLSGGPSECGPSECGLSEWWALWVWALWVWALWVVGPLSGGLSECGPSEWLTPRRLASGPTCVRSPRLSLASESVWEGSSWFYYRCVKSSLNCGWDHSLGGASELYKMKGKVNSNAPIHCPLLWTVGVMCLFLLILCHHDFLAMMGYDQ